MRLAHSLDHLVGAQLQRIRHFKAERASRLQVDDELEFGLLQHRQVGGLRSLEDLSDVDTRLTKRVRISNLAAVRQGGSPRYHAPPAASGFIAPCLATRADRVPVGPAWAHEIKHDGYRFIVRRDGDRVRRALKRFARPCRAALVFFAHASHDYRVDIRHPQEKTLRASRTRAGFGCIVAILAIQLFPNERTAADDKLLTEAVEFTGALTYLTTKVPGFILVAARNGETAFAGFGRLNDKEDKKPDPDTMFRIGSVSKVFCGEVLASMVLDGKLHFSDRLQDRLGYDVTVPEREGRPIRLIDLVTHSSGLPREVPRAEGPPNDPFGTNTKEAQIASLKSDPLLFPPGTAALYSNFGFDLLGAALANAGGRPYADVLRERVLDPLGMKDTVFNPRPGDETRVMQGHDFGGSPMPAARTPTSIECAGGLHSTANDMARWMNWHLDRLAAAGRELRLLDHAAYLYRDGLTAVAGLDDAEPMDAMGLGWVINMPAAKRPLVLQKSGGLQGTFAYLAMAPTRGAAAFFVMNEFSAGGFKAAVAATNGLIGQLAPR